MNQSFNLLFYVRKAKTNSKGEAPIYLRMTIDGIVSEISTKRNINPSLWNSVGQKVNGNSEAVKSLNFYLKTFEQSIQTSFDLAALIPDQFVKVSESGISKIETVRELRAVGYKGFLMGENFMKEENPASALVNFISSINPA